jgi:predicted RNA-binding Zn-ribbon protein involved in translation (DUF1610 family)
MGVQKVNKKKKFDDGSSFKRIDNKKVSKKGRRMFLQLRAETFRCKNCKQEVFLSSSSTEHRNHCPYCLYSLHVDISAGDRKSECHGSMKPIGLSLKIDGGEVMIIHLCQKCGKLNINRISAEDNEVSIMDIFYQSHDLSNEMIGKLRGKGLQIISDENKIKTLLFGKK